MRIEVKALKSIREKARGLLFIDNPYPVLLRTRFGIHTFGMRKSIDVLVLDSQNIVVKIKKPLLPNRIFLWNPSYDTVLELPVGTINKLGIKSGNQVTIVLTKEK